MINVRGQVSVCVMNVRDQGSEYMINMTGQVSACLKNVRGQVSACVMIGFRRRMKLRDCGMNNVTVQV